MSGLQYKKILFPFFVYGTLKRGFYNHIYLENTYFRCEKGTVEGKLYEVYGGAFPCLLEGKGTVHGELCWVEPDIYFDVMKSLDRLEGEGVMYERKLLTVTIEDGYKTKAWCYVWKMGEYAIGKEIKSGVFTLK